MPKVDVPNREVEVRGVFDWPDLLVVKIGMTEITLTQAEARDVAETISARLGASLVEGTTENAGND